jgi:sugar transferase (PEP-CTERM system associated)
LVLGLGEDARKVEHALIGMRALRFCGFYPAGQDESEASESRLSAAVPLARTARELCITDIVVALTERRGGILPQSELLECRSSGIRVWDLPSFWERHQGQVRLDSVCPGWLIFGDGFHKNGVREFNQRIFDLVCALILLLLASPLMVLTAIAIVRDSPGPVFYRQPRVGLGGRVFEVVKFRSMRSDAETDGTPRWAAANDDRVTRVGRIIRRFRIDELPQLWNVIRGEMRLIGPRPERPYFVARLVREVPFYDLRHSVKPGITGWAQVRYHYGDSMDDARRKLQYDLYYLKHASLKFDLAILCATVRVVLTGRGAH